MSITENQIELATLQITLSQSQMQALRELTASWGVELEDIARIVVLRLLKPQDEEARKATDYILEDDAELMRRLA